MKLKWKLLGILGLGIVVGQAMATGWTPQFARMASAAVNFINGFSGSFTLGGGLSVNTLLVQPEIAPWLSTPNTNAILQQSGELNALRNGSQTSRAHYKYMTQDKPATFPYKLGVAEFTGSISGQTLTADSVTGTIQLFQRVTDAVNFTTNDVTAVGDFVLNFADTTGIADGMRLEDLTNPRAIAGNIRVASHDSTTVTLTHEVGFSGNDQVIGSPGVGNGDVIAFSTIARGTYISGLGTCGDTPSYPCNYTISVDNGTIGSETMQSAGGWPIEGVYVIPVGTPGTSNYVECVAVTEGGNAFAPAATNCNVTGDLDDIIFRFPIDTHDAARFNCMTYTGTPLDCVSTNIKLLPVTFQLRVTYSHEVTSVPSLNTKNGCPSIPASQAGANSCLDTWVNASYDLAPVTLPGCDSGQPTPITCPYSYTWMPTGIAGPYEIEFHTNAMTDGQFIILNAFELKQTPGTTCNGSAPPCLQPYPWPIEVPEIVADMNRNKRFAQLLGTGYEDGMNPGNLGALETTAAFATSTTVFLSSWPLPVTMRCDVWIPNVKETPTCPAPNVYFGPNFADYIFTVAGGTEFVPSALAVGKIGLNSIQISATSSGMTAGAPGYVTWGSGATNPNMILIDSAPIGD